MRTFLLISNATVALLFTAFFAYTFYGREQIDGMAREFVTAKTQKYITPLVDVAEATLHLEITRRLLTKKQIAAIEAEIAAFRAHPARYIQELISAHAPSNPETFFGRASEKISGWKEKIRSYYNKVLRRLFTDLRIFSGSNVIAACIAFFCAWRSPARPSLQLTLMSGVLLLAIALGVYFYIDHFSFFMILFNLYLGWWYPVLLSGFVIANYFDYVSERKAGVA